MLARAPEELEKEDVGNEAAVIEVLSRTLQAQTQAITQMGHELRAEMRATRYWVIGLVALALVLMAGMGGVSAYVKAFGVHVDTQETRK